MRCPSCNKEMREETAGALKVDFCAEGCRGLWFDWFELEKLDNESEAAGARLAELSAGAPAAAARDRKLGCPRCAGMKLREHFNSPARKIRIDDCPQCGGVWLDAGELSAIRAEFRTEAARQALIDEFSSARVDEPLAREIASSRVQGRDRAKYSHLLRWLLRKT